MIVALIETTIANTLDMTTTMLHLMLSLYGKDYAMTYYNHIQQARTIAKIIFLEMRRRMLGMHEFLQCI